MTVKQNAELSSAIWMKGGSIPRYYPVGFRWRPKDKKSVNLSRRKAGELKTY